MSYPKITLKAISTELIAVMCAALIFAYLRRTSPRLRELLDDKPII